MYSKVLNFVPSSTPTRSTESVEAYRVLQGFAGKVRAKVSRNFIQKKLLREGLGELDELFYAELLGTEVEER